MKKKKNLISIIPAFLLMGAAVGIQTKNLTKHAVIGFIVGIIAHQRYEDDLPIGMTVCCFLAAVPEEPMSLLEANCSLAVNIAAR